MPNLTADVPIRPPQRASWRHRIARAAGVPVFASPSGASNASLRARQVKGTRPAVLRRSVKWNTNPPGTLKRVRGIQSISPFGPTLGGVEGVLDFIKDVVPSNTVVGKLLSGDVKGATRGAVQEVVRLRAGSSGGVPTPQVVPASNSNYYEAAVPTQNGGFLVNKPLLFASLGLGALGVFLLVRSRQ